MRNICIYAGRFHPWHLGHKFVYDFLVNRFGVSNVYITLTSVIEPPKSPFTFEERVKMMALTGVPEKQIVNVNRQYNALELESKISGINPNETILLFAISKKDMTGNIRFSKFTKKDGSPSYILPEPQSVGDVENMTKHAYLTVVPTKSFTLMGEKIISATQIREMFSRLMSVEYKEFMDELFGKYDKTVLNILKSKLQPMTTMTETVIKKSELKRLIKEFIREIKLVTEEESSQISPHANDIKSANVAAATKMISAKQYSLKDATDALKDAKARTTNIKRDKNAKPDAIKSAEESEDKAEERLSGAKSALDSAKKKLQSAQQGGSVD